MYCHLKLLSRRVNNSKTPLRLFIESNDTGSNLEFGAGLGVNATSAFRLSNDPSSQLANPKNEFSPSYDRFSRYNQWNNYGSTAESRSIFNSISLPYFEGSQKQIWIDYKTEWCHLCQEPLGSSVGVHIGERDHTTLQYFLFLYVTFPRGGWSIDNVLKDTILRFPYLQPFATNPLQIDHLHSRDDAVRRTELEGLLYFLSTPSQAVLSNFFKSSSGIGFWYSGERMWKFYITRMVTLLFPPTSPGIMTNFTQKCWGRTNSERLYDALRLEKILKIFESPPISSKERKTFFIRYLLFELMCAEIRPDISEFSKHVAELALHRMCMEMIFLQTMDYIHRVQYVYRLLGSPTLSELTQLNLM